MSLSKIDYPANGIRDRYKIPFPYLNNSDIHVYVDNNEVTYTFIKKGEIKLDAVPADGLTISIKRITDITALVALWTNKTEVFEADKENEIKKQLIYALQELQDENIQSLDAISNGDMYLKLDMNSNRIIGIADPIENTDSVPLKFYTDMFPPAPGEPTTEIGFSIGDTILSARTDQGDELVGGVQKWVPRDIPQQLIKTDYPELTLQYPETPGGLVGFGADFSVTIPDNNLQSVAYNLQNDSMYNLNYNAGSSFDPIKIFKNGVFLINLYPNNLGGEKDASFYSEGNFGISIYKNTILYTTDDWQTVNPGSINGSPPAYTEKMSHVHYINGKYMCIKWQSGNLIPHLVYSSDGITWDFVRLTDIGFSTSGTTAPSAYEASCIKYNSIEDVYYLIPRACFYGTFTTQVVKLNSIFTTSTRVSIIQANPYATTFLTGVDETGLCFGWDYNATDSFVLSNDFGNTFFSATKASVESLLGISIGEITSASAASAFVINGDPYFYTPNRQLIKTDRTLSTFELIDTNTIGSNMYYICIQNWLKDIAGHDSIFVLTNIFNKIHTKFDLTFGSNLTFDMPAVASPETNLKQYTKGKEL